MASRFPRSVWAAILLAFVVVGSLRNAAAIPAFARKYGLPCSACHEAWPKLNSFGQTFKDTGYQLMNDRDEPIWQNPSYWPVSMRITPHWHYESAGRQTVDSIPNDPTSPPIEKTINTSGFDLTGIDILTGGTLAKNISFLLVPSIDAGTGTIGFESANVRLDNLHGFMAGKLGLQRVGAYFFSGFRPTFFLTTTVGGVSTPLPGTGQGNRSFYRAGAYASIYLGRFDVTGVYQRASDNVFLANGGVL